MPSVCANMNAEIVSFCCIYYQFPYFCLWFWVSLYYSFVYFILHPIDANQELILLQLGFLILIVTQRVLFTMYRYDRYLSHATAALSCLVVDEVSFSIILSNTIGTPRCATAISHTDSNFVYNQSGFHHPLCLILINFFNTSSTIQTSYLFFS